jgi:electron transport complex protein RnfG
MRELINLALVLAIICSAAATALAFVYNLTKEPIAYQQRLKKLAAIKAVQPDYDNEPDQDFIDIPAGNAGQGDGPATRFYITRQGGSCTGVVFSVTSSGYGGPIEIMVGTTPEGTITGIQILNHTETPGLGAKITEERFLGQFGSKNFSNTNWALKKDGGEFDQITGATISPRAVVKAIHQGLKFFHDYKNQILLTSG